MKKIMGVIIVLFFVLNIRAVNADTNIKLGDTMTFSHASCKITNCVSNNDNVTVTFDEKECKYTGAKKGESVVKVTCDNNQQTTLNINVKVNFISNDNTASGNNADNNAATGNAGNVCSPLGKLKDDIKGVFKVFKIVAPILVIALSIFDFIKAAVGKVEGDLKKAFQKLMKRIIFAVILFFLPTILDWVLGLVDPGYNTCVNV